MKLKTMKIVTVVTLVVATSMCFAQGGGAGGGAGARGGGGGQRGGRMGGRQQFGYGLLRRADVQADLQLTADEKSKIDAIGTAMRDETRGLFPGGGRRGGGGGAGSGAASGGGTPPSAEERAAAMAKMKEIGAKYDKQYEAVLTSDQQKRVKEIGVQLAGNGVVRDPSVAKAIELTAAQSARIKTLEDELATANQAVSDKMRSGELDRTAGRDTMTKNNDALNVEIGKVLTDAQRAQLKTMGGKPFVAQPRGGGGGG